MKKMTILKSILVCGALALVVSGCNDKKEKPVGPVSDIEAIQVDPYKLESNYRDLRIKGIGYAGEQFTEHSRLVDDNGVTKEEKTYVVENVRALVVPVDFTDYPYTLYNETEDGAREELRKVMFGTPEEMEWYSLAEYYKQSSFGKCNITGSVAAWWHTGIASTSLPKDSESGKTDTAYASQLAVKIQDYYREHNDIINLADYDANKDGFVDTIIMIYTAPIETTGSLWWAFCSSVDGAFGRYTPSGNREGANRYFWASYGFLYERWNRRGTQPAQYTPEEIKAGVDMDGNPIHPDAHTMTHEYGHCLSLPDYYITDYNPEDYGAMGCLDMMDNNIGDHNAYSKMCYGWINPRRIAGHTGSLTLTLNSTTKTGDTIIIPAPDGWRNTYMDQYLVVEFLTPEGVAKADGEKQYLGYYPKYYSQAGIRILHIDSRMGVYQYSGAGAQAGYKFAGYTPAVSTSLERAYVRVAADNTMTRSCYPDYKIAEVLPSDGRSIKDHSGNANDACLYYEGDSFGQNGIWENFKMNGISGEKDKEFGFKIHVDKIDGNNSATITISR